MKPSFGLLGWLRRIAPRLNAEPDYPGRRRPSGQPAAVLLNILDRFGLDLVTVGRIISDRGARVSEHELRLQMISWVLGEDSIFALHRYWRRLEALYNLARALYVHRDFRSRVLSVLQEVPPKGHSIVWYIQSDDFKTVEQILRDIEERRGRFARPS